LAAPRTASSASAMRASSFQAGTMNETFIDE
jgi:hypothetical protein